MNNINVFFVCFISDFLCCTIKICILICMLCQGWEFAHLLISLKSNEQLWAIRSDRSRQMINHEQIAHFRSFPLSDLSESLRSLTKNEGCYRIALQKWATISNLLILLRVNEGLWANRSGRSPKLSEWVNCSFFRANRSFAHFWAKNEWFAWKTDEQIPSPGQ